MSYIDQPSANKVASCFLCGWLLRESSNIFKKKLISTTCIHDFILWVTTHRIIQGMLLNFEFNGNHNECISYLVSEHQDCKTRGFIAGLCQPVTAASSSFIPSVATASLLTRLAVRLFKILTLCFLCQHSVGILNVHLNAKRL